MVVEKVHEQDYIVRKMTRYIYSSNRVSMKKYRGAPCHFPYYSYSCTVQPRLSKPQLSVPSIIRTVAPGKIQGQSTKYETHVQCAHVQ